MTDDLRAAACRILNLDGTGADALALAHAYLADEGWPHLTNASRAKLYAACRSVGVVMDGKWLSESAIEAIEKLAAENARLRAVTEDPYDAP
jgi:hypothetical protein